MAEGIALHREGRLEEAERVYLAVLEQDERSASALHFLGVLRHQQGKSLQAVDLVRRAITLDPGYVDAMSNLGNILQQIGATVDAVAMYQRALELQPDHADALRNIGLALRKTRRFEEAAESLEAAVAGSPDNVENYYALAGAYKDLARYEEALAALRKSLEVKPQAEGFLRLGHMLYGLRRIDQAAAAYADWLRFEPDNAYARHMLAACSGKDVPGRADDAFVAQLFDGFAGDFDEVLARIDYRAPALVGAALAAIESEPRASLDILDAGCGTGLLASHLRPYARRLVGVDLSRKMLEKAASLARYDELEAAELTAYLRSSPQAFDVIASSDTLVYFGDLADVLAAAATALREHGRLVFTLEHAADDEAPACGYRLNPHGRYSHTEAYARRVLAQAGFELVGIAREALRRERGALVPGLVVCARLVNPLLALAAQRLAQGHSLAAVNLLRRAVELHPADADAWMQLGAAYAALGSMASALQAYRKVLELDPGHAQACRAAAPLQEETGRVERSIEDHRRAIALDPAAVDHLHALARECQQIDRIDEALEALRRALALRPEPQAFRRLGAMLSGLGRMEEAIGIYEAWLRAEPGNPIARHLLAACTGRDVPERGADAFVAAEFDRFAETFDAVLEKLEYRAPALVGAALRRSATPAQGVLEVLDAGCGTGLLAPRLRPYARRLVGVDLSPKMLEKAAARGLYDALHAAELGSLLEASPMAFDLVAASDTLNYFGDLHLVLGAAARSLRPGGLLVFTVEHAVDEASAPAGYRLHPDGRYMHAQPYVRAALVAAGFDNIEIDHGVLRREGDAYVAGLVIAARR